MEPEEDSRTRTLTVAWQTCRGVRHVEVTGRVTQHHCIYLVRVTEGGVEVELNADPDRWDLYRAFRDAYLVADEGTSASGL